MTGPIVLVLRLLMAAALYTFLGWALWTIWQDVRLQAEKPAVQKIPSIRLEIKARKRTLATRIYSQPEIILGRDPACDLFLNDETTSARHTKISYHHGHWWVEDLKSTNGTKLNRARLTIPVVLTSDDEIQCGNTKVVVELGDAGIDQRD